MPIAEDGSNNQAETEAAAAAGAATAGTGALGGVNWGLLLRRFLRFAQLVKLRAYGAQSFDGGQRGDNAQSQLGTRRLAASYRPGDR